MADDSQSLLGSSGAGRAAFLVGRSGRVTRASASGSVAPDMLLDPATREWVLDAFGLTELHARGRSVNGPDGESLQIYALRVALDRVLVVVEPAAVSPAFVRERIERVATFLRSKAGRSHPGAPPFGHGGGGAPPSGNGGAAPSAFAGLAGERPRRR